MIKPKKKSNLLELDLTGPEGNAFVLLGQAKSLSKSLGLNYDEIKKEMTSGDYENLIQVFEKNFGDYVILYR